MEKAMRWAILCAEEAAEPVLTAFVLPMWDDKDSSYARWLSHQTVQAIAASDRSKFKLNAPRHWAYEQDQWCTPKRNVRFLIVANTGWTVIVCATRQVEQRICLCTSAWEPTAKAKTAENDHTADNLNGRLVPAKPLLKDHKYPATASSLEEQPNSEDFSDISHKTELRFRHNEIMYTD